MKFEIVLVIAVAFVAFLFFAGVAKRMPKLYHAFIVPEGYAGLLYQHGKFVELLTTGWARTD